MSRRPLLASCLFRLCLVNAGALRLPARDTTSSTWVSSLDYRRARARSSNLGTHTDSPEMSGWTCRFITLSVSAARSERLLPSSGPHRRSQRLQSNHGAGAGSLSAGPGVDLTREPGMQPFSLFGAVNQRRRLISSTEGPLGSCFGVCRPLHTSVTARVQVSALGVGFPAYLYVVPKVYVKLPGF
ncbi:hypothetical protein B0T26DRAFT_89403 [Lasiosphaeria miniovina]|uniref:Secreted protein n=1 Tax=Lasiosphaeria miniovina TaxID=1954250 RepID=A0AA40BIR5_9PEZI|nr:uncharacterized protein B0T26DRAFT_89403 [Lasiosphaeria miniovina]KAK0734970.1 hypothetical protein B0T26DRAFT_89403 [Lasiosphaeria miniovina]